MKKKIIALVDGNNFFASCETLINPALKGKPVCVLSNNDGCVIARSNEAKELGIKMGMPYFMAKKSFPNAIYLSANFTLYHELSERMMQLLHNYSNIVDIYSIDEAFLDLTGSEYFLNLPLNEIAKKIKEDIERNIGINVSVGIANSKLLAKLATHKAKSQNGFYVIHNHLIFEEIQNIPVEEIWGIGKNIARTLRKYGIFYAHEILFKEDDFYKKILGKKGMEIKYELSGESVIPFSPEDEKPKSIQRTRAFPEFSRDKKYISTELLMHLHNVCKKLRQYNLKTSFIAVMLRTKDFRIFWNEEKLDFSTDSEIMLTEKINKLFDKIFNNDIIYRSSGVFAGSLINTETKQLLLFNNEKQNRSENLVTIIDNIENKYGKGVISIGATGIKSIQELHKRQIRHRLN